MNERHISRPMIEYVVIPATAVAAVGLAGLITYIAKRKQENKAVFVQGINPETADALGVIPTADGSDELYHGASEVYQTPQPTEEEQR